MLAAALDAAAAEAGVTAAAAEAGQEVAGREPAMGMPVWPLAAAAAVAGGRGMEATLRSTPMSSCLAHEFTNKIALLPLPQQAAHHMQLY